MTNKKLSFIYGLITLSLFIPLFIYCFIMGEIGLIILITLLLIGTFSFGYYYGSDQDVIEDEEIESLKEAIKNSINFDIDYHLNSFFKEDDKN